MYIYRIKMENHLRVAEGLYFFCTKFVFLTIFFVRVRSYGADAISW